VDGVVQAVLFFTKFSINTIHFSAVDRFQVASWQAGLRKGGEVREIYQAADATENVSLKWGNQGHQFYHGLMWPFIEQGLKLENK
jgi:hypothetical protein